MKLITKNLFLLILLFITELIYGQKNFIDGYIINIANDTIYGQINNNEYYKNSTFCEFKLDSNDKIIKYNPSDILGYRFIDSKYYVSREIHGTLRFLEYLIKGKVDIYFYQDKNKNNHYYASQDTVSLVELVYDKQIKFVDDSRIFVETKTFVGILNYMTRDCPELQKDISSIPEPNHKDLIGLAQKYHTKVCDNSECIIYEKKMPHVIKLQVQGGATYYYSYITNLDQQLFGAVGFQILMQQTQISEKLYLGLGFGYEGKTDELDFYRIPFSLNYINPKPGVSLYYGLEFDLYHFGLITYRGGLNYKRKRLYYYFGVDLGTALFVMPYSSSLKIGITYNIRK